MREMMQTQKSFTQTHQAQDSTSDLLFDCFGFSKTRRSVDDFNATKFLYANQWSIL